MQALRLPLHGGFPARWRSLPDSPALPPGAWLTDPERNIDWIAAAFGIERARLPERVCVIVCMAAYPLLRDLPTEAFLRRLLPVANGTH